MASLNLKFTNHIHDSFLHVSSSLYNKLFTQSSPLIQLTHKETFSFWCVKDQSIGDNSAIINKAFAESLKLSTNISYKVSLPSSKCVNLAKVIISLPFEAEDWKFLHENFELIQTTVLDQIRLIKRGDRIPIHTSIRKSPLWIFIEEFSGYQSRDTLGIISNDTELIVVEKTDNHMKNKLKEQNTSLIAVPSSQTRFSCNPSHNLPQICSFKDHNFKVLADERVPKNCIIIPHVILADVFKISPKDKIIISEANSDKSTPFSSFIHYTIDGSMPKLNPNEHNNETIISSSNGFSVKTSDSNIEQIVQLKCNDFKDLNDYAKLLRETAHRMILFHGRSGCGKTQAVRDAIDQLNFSPEFFSKLVYVDLLTSELDLNYNFNDSPISFIMDHVDEFLLEEAEVDEKVNKKYAQLCKKLENILLMHEENRVTLISRSSKLFSRFSSKISLPFDFIFTLEKQNSWRFKLNDASFDSVFGLSEAKSQLQYHILHPLQFADVYKSNQMNLHSSVLIYGPSGSGKTFLTQKFIEYNRIPCIFVRGPEILSKYVGSSERGVRDLFSRARNLKPCVIVFDEIDSLVPRRGSNQAGVTDRIVNQFLTELDGTEDRSGIFIIGTTSRLDLIDKAILRPGRIDQHVELKYPEIEEIKQFIQSKGLKSRKIKPLINFLGSDPNVAISWADLVAVDWENSPNPLEDLIKFLSVKKRTDSNEKSLIKTIDQKLSLA